MDKISKLRYIKHWSEQCVLTAGFIANSAIIATWLGSMRALDYTGSKPAAFAVSGAMLVASLGVKFYYEKHKDNLVKKHHAIFTNKSQAKRVLVRAAATMEHLDPRYGLEKLKNGLHYLDGHITRTNLTKHSMLLRGTMKRQPPTPGGYELNGLEKLPSDDAEAYRVVMHEALFDYVSTYSRYSEYVVTTDEEKPKLSQRAQEYIVANDPDLIMLNPTLFDAGFLDKHLLGLANVVQTLSALSCAPTSMHKEIKSWSETREIPDTPKPDLPTDLLGFNK